MNRYLITSLFTILLICCLLPLKAQDAVKMAGSVYQKLMENERIRLLKMDFQPEERTIIHFHPDHLLYALDGGKIAITDTSGGNATVIELDAGDYHWFKGGKHSIVNIGSTTITAIVIELKEPDAMKPEDGN